MLNKEIIEKIDIKEYKDILKKEKIDNIPIYMDPNAITFYEEIEILKVNKANKTVAVFAYPLYREGEEIWVKRDYRVLPYSSPLFLYELDTLHRKKICYEIFNYMFEKYDVVYIPLSPQFREISAIQALGGFLESRNTNIITNKLEYSKLSPKLRNHINHANKEVTIIINQDISEFKFEIAIKGTKKEQDNRRKLAEQLVKDKKGIVLTAYKDEQSIAGAVIIYDYKTAYLLHSWQNEDTIRGCIPLIIYKAIEWCFDNLSIDYFDFEGSVINKIDDFFASFNTEIMTYPYIHFAKQEENMKKIIYRSINIDGRKEIKNGYI